MRQAHANSVYIYTIDEVINMIQSHEEYGKTPSSFIIEKLKYFSQSYCDECGSKKGTFHDNDWHCKYYLEGVERFKKDDSFYDELGEFTKYYRDPFNGWHEYNLMKYRENPEYQCRICGEGAYEKDKLCREHAKKLYAKLRKSRKMHEEAYKEATILELEFYTYETKKAARELEKRNNHEQGERILLNATQRRLGINAS